MSGDACTCSHDRGQHDEIAMCTLDDCDCVHFTPDVSDVDISNSFLVAAHGDSVVVLTLGKRLTREAALVFAAWLVAIAAEGNDDRFSAILQKVRAS
jgi:hypothetical protein